MLGSVVNERKMVSSFLNAEGSAGGILSFNGRERGALMVEALLEGSEDDRHKQSKESKCMADQDEQRISADAIGGE